jgi:hypothetical protein
MILLAEQHMPLESTQISASFRFWSLFISLCLVNLRFRLVISPEVTDDSDGIFLFVLIPSLENFFRCFSRHLQPYCPRIFHWHNVKTNTTPC